MFCEYCMLSERYKYHTKAKERVNNNVFCCAYNVSRGNGAAVELSLLYSSVGSCVFGMCFMVQSWLFFGC